MERSWIYYQIPVLKEFAHGNYSVEGWFSLVRDGGVMTHIPMNPSGGQSVAGVALLSAVADYPQAKEALIAHGASAVDVENRPVAAVLEEFFSLRFSEISDDTFKWNGVEADQAIAAWESGKVGAKYFGGEQPQSFADVMCRVMIPALSKARFNAVRLDRRVKMLEIVEALRASAAEKGVFPATLEGMDLPLPAVDPVTGKGFGYRRDGAAATLSSPPTDVRTRDDEWHVSVHP